MSKKLPKKHEKLTMEHFKQVKDSLNWPYWSFKFGLDGLVEYEIVLWPNEKKNLLFATIYDEKANPTDYSGSTSIAYKKSNNNKGDDPKLTKESWARVLKMANDLYSKFYE